MSTIIEHINNFKHNYKFIIKDSYLYREMYNGKLIQCAIIYEDCICFVFDQNIFEYCAKLIKYLIDLDIFCMYLPYNTYDLNKINYDRNFDKIYSHLSNLISILKNFEEIKNGNHNYYNWYSHSYIELPLYMQKRAALYRMIPCENIFINSIEYYIGVLLNLDLNLYLNTQYQVPDTYSNRVFRSKHKIIGEFISQKIINDNLKLIEDL